MSVLEHQRTALLLEGGAAMFVELNHEREHLDLRARSWRSQFRAQNGRGVENFTRPNGLPQPRHAACAY
jgi:hypothetical protein